jgi:hypothetical protein
MEVRFNQEGLRAALAVSREKVSPAVNRHFSDQELLLVEALWVLSPSNLMLKVAVTADELALGETMTY